MVVFGLNRSDPAIKARPNTNVGLDVGLESTHKKYSNYFNYLKENMAERVGFEPTVELPPRRIS
ncbi:MAG: hypothetical protein RID59_03390, partial [Hoeflea sp.]